MKRRFRETEEITIRHLYPNFSDEELQEAKENLERYLEVVLRIYGRVRGGP